jgi:hypothetical protein
MRRTCLPSKSLRVQRLLLHVAANLRSAIGDRGFRRTPAATDYCCGALLASPAVSTRTPAPIVLDTLTFFR